MHFPRRLPCLVYILVLSAALTATSALAQTPRIVVSVGDTMFVAGSRNSFLTLRLTNLQDSVAGVGLWLKSERPDLVTFNFTGAGFDSSAALISGWEYVQVVDSLNNGVYWQLATAADFYPDSVRPAPIGPQSGGRLIRVPLFIPPNPDTTQPLIAPISLINRQEFSTPAGKLIGVVTDTLVDTSYFACQGMIGDSCTLWIEVDPNVAPYDSIAYDSSLVGYIDTTVVVAVDGSVTLLPTKECDITTDNTVDLSDLICLVNYLFLGQTGAGCVYFGYCDFSPGGGVDLSDLVALVNYLFLPPAGPPG